MKKLLISLFALATLSLHAASPAYENFDPAIFVRIGDSVYLRTNNVIGVVSTGSSATATWATNLWNPWITARYTNCVYVATNGNNANNGFSQITPKLTPLAGCNLATNGQTVLLGAGFYNITTNILVLASNVHFVGQGKGVTILLSSADLGGPESLGIPTGGPVINPGTNSYIAGFTIRCDTNTIIPLIPAGHTGTWGGIGVSQFNPPSNRTFQNVTIEDVDILDALFDCLHFNSRSNLNNIIARRVTGRGTGCGFYNEAALGALDTRASYILENCNFVCNATDPGGTGAPSISYGFSGDVMMIGCRGEQIASSGGYTVFPVPAPTADVRVFGCEFINADVAEKAYQISELSGWYRHNMTNYNTASIHTTTSAATSGTVTATAVYGDETIYLSSGSTIASITIALPTVTRIGQTVRIHPKSAITTLTVTGGTFIDAAVITMTAGQTVSYRATDMLGTYLRIQ